MRQEWKSRRGNTVLEFTLVGIPLVFVLVSIFEISRGMWIYHTLAHAIKAGVRYAAVHGQNCRVAPNTCPAPAGSAATYGDSIGAVAYMIQSNGAGLIPGQFHLTFCAPMSGTASTCLAGSAGYVDCPTLSDCLTNNTQWPPTGANRVGFDDVKVIGIYPFASAIALVWPGSRGSDVFPTFNLPASAREKLEF